MVAPAPSGGLRPNAMMQQLRGISQEEAGSTTSQMSRIDRSIDPAGIDRRESDDDDDDVDEEDWKETSIRTEWEGDWIARQSTANTRFASRNALYSGSVRRERPSSPKAGLSGCNAQFRKRKRDGSGRGSRDLRLWTDFGLRRRGQAASSCGKCCRRTWGLGSLSAALSGGKQQQQQQQQQSRDSLGGRDAEDAAAKRAHLDVQWVVLPLQPEDAVPPNGVGVVATKPVTKPAGLAHSLTGEADGNGGRHRACRICYQGRWRPRR
jgi:hypothetical protein